MPSPRWFWQKSALHFGTNALYGYHRDELYYLASGDHPAFGLCRLPASDADTRPPLQDANAVARQLAVDVADCLWPSVVGASLVVLAALIARELGGGRRAQILAALAAVTSLLVARLQLAVPDGPLRFDELWWIATI